MKISQAAEIEDLRKLAKKALPRIIYDWIEEGAGDELAAQGNLNSFRQFRLLPRYMRDVSERTQTVQLFGQEYSSPIGFSPTGMQGLVHAGGELKMARAAVADNIPYVMSGLTTVRLENVAEAAPSHLWYQPYPTANRAIIEDLLRRAADAGVKNLVLTADLPVEGHRLRSIHNRRSGRPNPWLILEALRHPRWVANYLKRRPLLEDLLPYAAPGASRKDLDEMFGREYAPVRPKQTWSEIEWYRRLWSGKLIIKGIISPKDATSAVDLGVDGIVVSNHGGRQLDRAPAPLDMLPIIKMAVGDNVEVMLDGGIRTGSDVVIALCLGARFVFIGRAALFGLAAGGHEGVRRAIQILQAEIDVTMGQIGCTCIEQLSSDYLWQKNSHEYGDISHKASLLTGRRPDVSGGMTQPESSAGLISVPNNIPVYGSLGSTGATQHFGT
ncbi:alpha-hydroxy acid oxidase [Microvirga soli]|uniref:alpha-hydroxy acid oxidase n=1 Tax=Microvirga soli TaxID=1854496 RepID=UPI00191D2E29|nr:alpha-hydroxy acid oxidase [Microvirga soli]